MSMMPGERPLTLSVISEDLVAEYGLREIAATPESYRCDDQQAIPVCVGNVLAPMERKLNDATVRQILSGIRDGVSIPAVTVVPEFPPEQVTLLDGLHRFRVSLALGFRMIPCRRVSPDVAEAAFGYWRRL